MLDIFGFEDFEVNSFEQFCINFANENLQYYLNQHIFKIRQDEYISEGLQWDTVTFVDNESCLNLISGRPVGMINLLDEECRYVSLYHEFYDECWVKQRLPSFAMI